MALVKWTDSLCIGNDAIDAQHKSFIDLINDLHDSVHGKPGKSVLEAVFCLQKYALFHLIEEEAYMVQNGFEYTDEHTAQHDILRNKVGELDSLVTVDEQEGKLLLLEHITDWFVNHIIKYDTKLCAKEN